MKDKTQKCNLGKLKWSHCYCVLKIHDESVDAKFKWWPILLQRTVWWLTQWRHQVISQARPRQNELSTTISCHNLNLYLEVVNIIHNMNIAFIYHLRLLDWLAIDTVHKIPMTGPIIFIWRESIDSHELSWSTSQGCQHPSDAYLLPRRFRNFSFAIPPGFLWSGQLQELPRTYVYEINTFWALQQWCRWNWVGWYVRNFNGNLISPFFGFLPAGLRVEPNLNGYRGRPPRWLRCVHLEMQKRGDRFCSCGSEATVPCKPSMGKPYTARGTQLPKLRPLAPAKVEEVGFMISATQTVSRERLKSSCGNTIQTLRHRPSAQKQGRPKNQI